MKNSPAFDLFNPVPDFHQKSEVNNHLNANLSVIEGLKYIPNFISESEEQQLINIINSQEWLGDLKRRVQHYGWKYDYRARSLNYNMYLGPLPEWIQLLAKRLIEKRLMNDLPDQVIINEYKPGQGIANHVDCEPCFGDTIVSLSLATSCVMNFINLDSKEKIEAWLEPRSVVSISGNARYCWSHGITPRLADEVGGMRINRQLRISMTFRKAIV